MAPTSEAAGLVADGDSPSGQVATDTFSRTVAGSLGQADRGGTWGTTGTGVRYSTAGGVAHLLMSNAGRDGTAYLPSALPTDTDIQATITFPKRATGGGSYLSVLARRVPGQGDYRLKFRHWSTDRVTVSLVRVLGNTETALTPGRVVTESYVPGTPLRLAIRVRGTGTTSVFGKVWIGSTEPAGWALQGTDSAPGLQTAGSLGVLGYLSTTASAPEEVLLDNLSATTPVTSLVDPAVSSATALSRAPSSNTSFAFTSNTMGSRFQCKLDGGTWAACASPASYASLADGSHTFIVRAVDSDGFAATPATRTWSVDTTAPVLTVQGGPAAGSVTQATGASFGLATDEAATVECRLDGGAWTVCTSDTAAWRSLADGQHNVAFRATDAAGNVSDVVTRAWGVDTTAPDTSVSVTPAADATTTRNRMVVKATSTEPGTLECKLDVAAWGTCTLPLTLDDLSIGAHSFAVRGVDSAGNADLSPAATNWTTTLAPIPVTAPTQAPAPAPAPSGVKPDASNTGVPAGTNLTPYYGNLVITRAGTVIDGLDVHGLVQVKADNVTIKNSVVHGGDNLTVDTGMVSNYGYANLLVEDTSFVADHESVYQDGMHGWNYTLRRVHITGNVDSAKVHGSNVTIEDSLLENPITYASDPYQNGAPSHSDGVQIIKGDNITIRDNTIRGAKNFEIVGATGGDVSHLDITGNWLDGGHCTMKLEHKTYNLAATVTDNKFGPHRTVASCPIAAVTGSQLTFTHNYLEADPTHAVNPYWVTS